VSAVRRGLANSDSPFKNMSNSSFKLSDVVVAIVLYNPQPLMTDNHGDVASAGLVVFVDNSEDSARHLLSHLNFEYKYIHNGNRAGIAGALNEAASCAVNSGFKWLLTVDQDSSIGLSALRSLFNCVSCVGDMSEVGIIAPYQKNMLLRTNAQRDDDCWDRRDASEVMTSGSLMSLDVWQKLGGFREDFFIDAVDHEYCRRCRKNGFRVIECREYLIEHQLGELMYKNVMGFTVGVTNHGYLRCYYIFRNTLMLIWLYRGDGTRFIFGKLIYLIKLLLKIVLFEKSKLRKIGWICSGIFDFFRGRMGKA
jgi:rhamnosyltransferase